ncbi:Hypothetical protein HVR_LOCUS844 [uncultured virus]|nr:Hypothetical protein HVR_LOCUS844 [uncultured virus]
MAVRTFLKDLKVLIETEIPDTIIIPDEDDVKHITIIIKDITFHFNSTNDYPFSPPKISYVNRDDKLIPVNILLNWSPVIALTGLVYALMLDYIPCITDVQLDPNVDPSLSILDTMKDHI